jgi:phosphate transport system substrate-binding protein
MRSNSRFGSALALFIAASAAAHAATIKIDGSKTMAGLNESLARAFEKSHAGVVVKTSATGTQFGIQEITNGGIDIAAASRAFRPEELQKMKKAHSHGPIDEVIALEGISIYLHPSNKVRVLTFQQLADIYTGKITNWKELGGEDVTITPYARENTTGKYWYFKEEILRDKEMAKSVRTAQGTDGMMKAILNDRGGIGYGPVGSKASVALARVRRDASSPAVAPTMGDVKGGTYPLVRQLRYFVAEPPNGVIKEFLAFALSPAGQQIARDAGFISMK